MALTKRDEQRLATVHPVLAELVRQSERWVPLMVVEGARSLAKQKEYFAKGKSRTMNSRHLPKAAAGVPEPVSHAVDLAPLVDLDRDGDLDLSWNAADFKPLAAIMKDEARKAGVAIVWGGDWKGFVDMPHFELDRKVYP